MRLAQYGSDCLQFSGGLLLSQNFQFFFDDLQPKSCVCSLVFDIVTSLASTLWIAVVQYHISESGFQLGHWLRFTQPLVLFDGRRFEGELYSGVSFETFVWHSWFSSSTACPPRFVVVVFFWKPFSSATDRHLISVCLKFCETAQR